jgi:hypothetical protein
LRKGTITVSKRSSLANAPGAVERIRRAVITGESPTTANSRPPGFSCCSHESGRTGVEPVSTIASYCRLSHPRAQSPTSRRALTMPARASLPAASADNRAMISTLVTAAQLRASSAVR